MFERVVADSTPAQITADPDRLRQALENLLGNAFKWTRKAAGSASKAKRGTSFFVHIPDTGSPTSSVTLDR